jgi:hypothetical protein
MASRERSDGIAVVVGCTTLAGYVIQARSAPAWPWLAELQTHDTYKVASGLVLAAYLIFQWSVASRRRRDPTGAVVRHKLGGALAPLVLYLHASRFGYGYLALLGFTYLGTAGIGLLHRPVLAHARSGFTVWFVVHVATAASLVVLGGYHVVIALAYE